MSSIDQTASPPGPTDLSVEPAGSSVNHESNEHKQSPSDTTHNNTPPTSVSSERTPESAEPRGSPPPPHKSASPPTITRRHSTRYQQHDTRFIITERIGKGSFATVYKGEWGGDLRTADGSNPEDKQTGSRQKVAIKVVQRSHLKKEKRLMGIFEAEMAILKKMKHPHVVHLIDVVKTSTDFNLIMEYCSLGDLSYFIRKKQHLIKRNPDIAQVYARYPSNRSGLHPHLVRHFLAQLACSLAFLREHDIVHRDVKPQNLLLKPGASSAEEAAALGYAGSWDLPVVKIADFGFARFLPSTSMAETLCGSPLYMAPEILNYEKYNAKADLWSVGAVTYEMATGKPPFPAVNHLELIRKIDSSKDQITFPFPIEPDLEEIIRGLLKRQPSDRMNFDDFFQRAAWSENLSSAELGSISRTKVSRDNNGATSASTSTSATNSTAATTPVAADTTTGSQPTLGLGASTETGAETANPAGTSESNESITKRTGSAVPANATVTTPDQSRANLSSQPDNDAADFASNDNENLSYSQYLRNQGANSFAIESPTPSPSPGSEPSRSRRNTGSSESKHRGNRGEGKAGDSENEYVFIEKRMVEVNALADDLQASPGIPRRRLTNPDQVPRRRRLSSIAYGASPTSALAQALLKSSARLFGAKADSTTSVNIAGSSAATTTATTPASQSGANSILFSMSTASPQTGEKQTIDELEQLATIGKVVSLYAEVKYMQLDLDDNERSDFNESLDSDEDGPFLGRSTDIRPSPSPGSYIDPFFQMKLANESLVLHLKALSILAKAMARASEWWEQHQSGSDVPTPSPGINSLVQWIRDKFNECIYRAENERALVKRLVAETDTPAPETTAERLLFDRALEMAKAAAVQEMTATENSGSSDTFSDAAAACEMNYGTAVWMLRSLLIAENEHEELSDQDRTMVETLMAKIAQRLVGLRRKLASNSQASLSSDSEGWKRKSDSPGVPQQRSVNFGRRASVSQLTPP